MTTPSRTSENATLPDEIPIFDLACLTFFATPVSSSYEGEVTELNSTSVLKLPSNEQRLLSEPKLKARDHRKHKPNDRDLLLNCN